ncbi:rod-binding protein, partial [Nitrospinota bacterium]
EKGGSLARRARNLQKNGDEAALRQFSKDFESLFLQRLLKEMRKGIPKGGLMDKSMSMEWFEGMFDEAVSNEVSKGSGIGLSQVIYEQLTKKVDSDRPLSNLADYRDREKAQGAAGVPDQNGAPGKTAESKAKGGPRE